MTLPFFGPISLTDFAHPWFFVFLAFVVGLVALYVITQLARQKRILRFANMELLESVAPKRPNRWRHLSAILLICSLLLLTIAMAGPQNDVRTPRNRAVVMLVIDVSQSMRATDVEPSRLAAAQAAAKHVGPGNVLPAFVDQAWLTFGRPDFKIVIEIWLAARNDPALRTELGPVIGKFRELASPADNPELARTLGDNPAAHAFYRLVMETMIGMALGRALSPSGEPMGHEESVLALLRNTAEGLCPDISTTPRQQKTQNA